MRLFARSVIAVFMLVAPGSLNAAEAAPVTWRFSGSMDSGVAFAGGLVFEDSLVPDPLDMDYAQVVRAEYSHPLPIYSLFVDIGNSHLVGGPWDVQSIQLFNNVPWEGGIDRVGIYARVGSESGSSTIGTASLLFVDGLGTWLPGIFPLSVLTAPDVRSLTAARFSFAPTGGAVQYGQIEEVSAVPEPPAIVLVACAGAIVLTLSRSRRPRFRAAQRTL